MKCLAKTLTLAAAFLVAAALAASAAVPIWLAPNATFNLGTPPTPLHWNDALYNGPNDYGDWTVGGPYYIDGDANFIWLRSSGQWAKTVLDWLCTDLVVCFGSDSNDGVAEILVDDVAVAVIDTWTNPGVLWWYVRVNNLTYRPHEIWVIDNGDTYQLPDGNGADDVSIDGAGAMDGQVATSESSWGSVKALY